MKKLIISLFTALIFYNNCYSQFYIVEDPDGYVNVRGEGNSIIDRVPDGTIVYAEMPETEWAYNYNSIYISCIPEGYESHIIGNIHESRLKPIDEFEPFTITSMDTVNYMSVQFSLEKIRIDIQTDYFDEKNHTVSRYANENYSYITSIDSMEFWYPNHGANMLPFTELKSIRMNIDNNEFNIPSDYYKDLFNLNIYSTRAFFDPSTDTIYIIIPGGDGGEAYAALFVLKKGEFIRRYMAA